VRIKYLRKYRYGKAAQLNGLLQRIGGQAAPHALTTRLVQKEGKRLGFCVPRWGAHVYRPSFWFDRHFESSSFFKPRTVLIVPVYLDAAEAAQA
jgi:hypothetical protein